ATWYVRWKVREEIKKLSHPEARSYLVAAAKGAPKGPKKLRIALQAAAVSVLGTFANPSYLAVMEDGLKHESPLVRAFAAEGLAAQADVKSVPAVVAALQKEQDELARNRMFFAFLSIYSANRGAVGRKVVQNCEPIAADTLGKGSWHSDMVAIDFARFARSRNAVPKLIELLARFVEHPEDIAAGKLTGRQRTFAYEILTDVTGAYYAMDDAKGWRDYWKRSKETFQVANNRKTVERRKAEFEAAEKSRRAALGESEPAEATANKPQPTVGMSTGKIFGTPIRGGRVLFILDVSNTTMDGVYLTDARHLPEELKGKKRTSRLDVMKAQLRQAIDSLTTDTYFNIVAAAGAKPRMWQKKGPVAATAANKKAAQKFLKSQGGGAWSNPYDAIETGLGIQNQAWGQLGTHGIDEVFMLMARRAELGKLQHVDDIIFTVRGIADLARISFHTSYLGPENDEHDTQGMGKYLMEHLAKATNGKFIRP
ncbi:MAG: HEAT repeat domain-containing protein, partial [Planctomycetota bacterium]